MIFLLPSAYNTRLKPAMASQPQRYGGHEERISLDRASTQTSVLIFSNWKFFLYDVNIMKYVSSTRSRVMVDNGFRPHCQSCVPQVRQSSEEFVSKLLDRRWALPSPHTKFHQITLSPTQLRNGGTFGDTCLLNNAQTALGDGMMAKDELNPSFYILRDDLLHPLVNGNKARKLDGLLPLIEDHSVTDVVTCGGCQSAHAAAVAVSCAERGLKSHLLLRGEQPEILTGYNLISTIYGNVTYVPRSLYANRKEMLKSHANLVAGNSGSVVLLSDIFEASFTSQTSSALNLVQMDANRSAKNCPRKVVIVNEGAGEAVAMLGVIRLVQYLSQNHLFGTERPMKIVVDAGTGTTAVGLGIGALCLGLPWEVTAVMLADTVDGYKQQEKRLISDFKRCFSFLPIDHILNKVCEGIVSWVDRRCPRRFGKVLEGEVEACQQIARQTGILVDPMYTLAAWEMAALLSEEEKGAVNVVMLHTGGTLGMFGLAQRYRSSFRALKDGLST